MEERIDVLLKKKYESLKPEEIFGKLRIILSNVREADDTNKSLLAKSHTLIDQIPASEELKNTLRARLPALVQEILQ